MARETYVLRNGELVPKHLAEPLHAPRGSAAPMIRTDGMEAIQSMADGRFYDSRSSYYGSLKARGLEIVGNERAAMDQRPVHQPTGIKADMQAAIQQLTSGGRNGR